MFDSKLLSIILLFLRFVAAEPPDPHSEFCFPVPFQFLIYSQCPPVDDLRCVQELTKTKDLPNVLNCALVEPRNSSEVMIVDGNLLIEQLKEVDPFGRPLCSLVFFYSPNCVFSSRVAGYVFSLAQLFPKLRVFALNVENKAASTEQLINQHGIAATPVLFIFENHVARVRLHEDGFRPLVELLLKKTDLTLPPEVKRQDLNTIGNTSDGSLEHFAEYRDFILNFFQFSDLSDGIDRYYILANLILLINIFYFTYLSPRLSQWWPENRR